MDSYTLHMERIQKPCRPFHVVIHPLSCIFQNPRMFISKHIPYIIFPLFLQFSLFIRKNLSPPLLLRLTHITFSVCYFPWLARPSRRPEFPSELKLRRIASVVISNTRWHAPIIHLYVHLYIHVYVCVYIYLLSLIERRWVAERALLLLLRIWAVEVRVRERERWRRNMREKSERR